MTDSTRVCAEGEASFVDAEESKAVRERTNHRTVDVAVDAVSESVRAPLPGVPGPSAVVDASLTTRASGALGHLDGCSSSHQTPAPSPSPSVVAPCRSDLILI